MDPSRAITMENFFPQPGWVELRRGSLSFCQIGSNSPVETLVAYNGATTSKLIAVTGGAIYDVTGGQGSAVSMQTGLSGNRFQTANFTGTGGNYLYMVNGLELPYYYNGTVWARPTITGAGIDPTKFIGVNVHKGRIWFVIDASMNAAYLPVDSIQGAAVRFPMAGVFNKGGYLVAMATWSLDGGTGLDDYAVFVTSRGQVAIYSGVDPATDFQLVGVFDIGAPIGRRCITKVGADLVFICIDGVLPLSKAMVFERAAMQRVSMTDNISREMNIAARSYADNFGWELISYPRGTRALLNIPVTEGADQVQFVMNTLTGAWCRFTGMHANCWELFNDLLYFGGNDGTVYLTDQGSTDNGKNIHAELQTAFSYYGARGNQKRWMMSRVHLTTDQQITPGIAFNVDFRDDAPIYVQASSAVNPSLWDQALWDVSEWPPESVTVANWNSVSGIGYCASIKVAVDTVNPLALSGGQWGVALWGVGVWGSLPRQNVTFNVNSFDVTMEAGGMI